MRLPEGTHLFSNGVLVVNTTPHSIRFQETDGSLVEVPSNPKFLVNARAVETKVSDLLVKTAFVGTDDGTKVLNTLEDYYCQHAQDPNSGIKHLAIVGSVIAAQAYPGRVVAMTPVPGFERVAPAEKRMSIDKFTTY